MAETCPLCASSATRVTYLLPAHRIAQCEQCGFEFHDGFRGGGDDDAMFSDHYYKVVQKDAFEKQFADPFADPSAPVFSRRLDQLAALASPGRLLDVGSALGTFLKIADSRGYAAEGVEISRFAAEFARERRGARVFNGDLEQFDAPDASFDVVTFWDSIEHVTHPRENLLTAHRLLRPGGLVLLATDNFDSLVCDIGRLMYRLSGGRLAYGMNRVFVPPNRSYFTERVFRALLDRCGFDVVAFEKMEYPLVKIRANPVERLILRTFYLVAGLLHRQAQMTVIARKRA